MRFLIIKLSSLGDLIVTLPFANWIKELYPEANVDWVVEKRFETLIQAHPHVDRIIAPDVKGWKKRWPKGEIVGTYKALREERYEAVFDFQGNVKSSLFTLFAKSSVKYGFSNASVPEWPNLFVTNRKIRVDLYAPISSQLAHFFKEAFGSYPSTSEVVLRREARGGEELPPSPRFMVCPGANWDNKRLKHETLIEFLKRVEIEIKPSFLFIWGSESEREEAETLQRIFPRSLTYGKLEFGFWQELMGKVDLVMTMDSAPLHLCGMTPTPSFSIFGPSRSSVYRPVGDHHFSFEGVCPYDQRFVKRCPKLRTCPTGACMKEISPGKLFEAFQNFWRSLPKSM